MIRPKILSIVTPSYNHAVFIEETIRSVVEQQGDFYIDYIIMDGGSKDTTPSILKEYEQAISENTEWESIGELKFYRGRTLKGQIRCQGVSYRWMSEKDAGQSDAINKGMRLAVGEIVAFLNSDDTYYPGALQKIMAQNWKRTDLVYGKGMWIAKDGRELLPYPTYRPGRHNFFFQCTLCQPTVFMKKQTFDSLGEFSTDFHVIFDFEYWMRAVFQGKKFRYVNAYLATSRFYVENKTMAEKGTQVNELPLLLKKYYTARLNRYERLMRLLAKHTVHRNTVKQVNKLHELIHSDTRYAFK